MFVSPPLRDREAPVDERLYCTLLDLCKVELSCIHGSGMKIYFLQHGGDGPIKIGRAANPKKRMASMQVACPYDFTMLAVIDAPISVERGLHAMFDKHWIRGEWFLPAAELIAFIKALPNVELPHDKPPPPKPNGKRGNPYGRKVEIDLAAALKHLRKHGDLSAAARSIGVTRQALWYHVEKSNELRKLVKSKK